MRVMTMRVWMWMFASAISAWLSAAAMGSIATFDDLSLPANSYWNGSSGAGSFTSGGMKFANTYDTTWKSWDGWAYSNMSNTSTPDWGNQYSAITGHGYNGSAAYGVAYDGVGPTVTFPHATVIDGAYFTNTTYAYLSMKNGDSFAKKFGGTSGNDPDWFTLTITGKDSGGAVIGAKDFYLADYRFANNTQDYAVNTWTWVDLTSLGTNVKSLNFSLSSSDNGVWGMNTPAFFAIDNLTASPEPSTLLLIVTGGLAALAWRWWRRKQ